MPTHRNWSTGTPRCSHSTIHPLYTSWNWAAVSPCFCVFVSSSIAAATATSISHGKSQQQHSFSATSLKGSASGTPDSPQRVPVHNQCKLTTNQNMQHRGPTHEPRPRIRRRPMRRTFKFNMCPSGTQALLLSVQSRL